MALQDITDFDVTTSTPDPVLPPEPSGEPAAAESAAVVAPPELAQTEEDAAEEAAIEQQERDDAGKFKPKRSLQAKIDRVVAEREEARREAAAAKQERDRVSAELAALRTPKAPEPAPVAPAAKAFPTLEEYAVAHPESSYEDYLDARAEAKFEAKLAARDAEQQAKSAQQNQQAQIRALEAQIVVAKTKYPDWDTKMAAGDAAFAQAGLQMPPVMIHAICASEQGAEIMRDLAEHPADAIQLAKDAAGVPVAAAHVMRRLLEHRLSTTAAHSGPAAPTRTLVPPPIKPVGSGPVTSDTPPGDDATYEEHERYYNALDRKKRRG